MRNTKPLSPAVRTAAFSVCALLAATVLTACGAGDGGDAKAGKDGVSTLETGSPASDGKPGASESSKTDSRRPQLRMDSSDEERDRLGDAYNACLQAHGVPMNTKRAGMAGAKQAAPMQSMEIAKKYKPAYDACLVKLPLQPPELDSNVNPHYTDQYRVFVKCLKAKGAHIHMTQDEHGVANGYTYDDDNGMPEAEEFKASKVCQKESFSVKH
ncbi:hypothetical protein [Streptomyces pinistramenti]|uniref:hypothetical protein n=1 Tax=Streptomyces pinistramenti TaxID=2884812 RepID=UPI001D06FDCC|nr:hypothetical protein [Streptomyces pinistramenti]MCB5906507.1 hypothetical protein [Streptomyces pinistramenti]